MPSIKLILTEVTDLICGNEGIVALIPVRGGSKGIPRKNMELLGDHPLMAWPIKLAKSVPEIDRVIVSTEDDELRSIGFHYGAELDERDMHLASDTAGVYDVIMELKSRLIKEEETIKYMILLEATSPFRSVEMIHKAISLLEKGYDSVASFCNAHTHPDKVWRINGEHVSTYIEGVNPWTTRQELSPAYELTGEIYAFNLNMLTTHSPSLMVGRCAPIVIDADKSVDINSYKDLLLARLMFDDSPLASLN